MVWGVTVAHYCITLNKGFQAVVFWGIDEILPLALGHRGIAVGKGCTLLL